MVRKLHNFDDWIDYFKYWQDSIGLPEGAIRAFRQSPLHCGRSVICRPLLPIAGRRFATPARSSRR